MVNLNMNSILKQTKEKLNKNILFTNESDVYFLTRFKSSNLSVFLIEGKWYALTDPRYIELAKKEIVDMTVIDSSKKGWFEKIMINHNIKDIYLSEKDTTISQFKLYEKSFHNYGIKLKTFDYENIRDIYLDEDIELLKKSSEINDSIMNEIISEIRIGMTEIQVANIILKKTIDSDATCPSFDPIVASGVSGSNPHWTPGNKIINKNEMVTIDMGVFYKGQASDMTRTFVVEGDITEEEKKIWNTVKIAMNTSIQMIKPGVSCSDLHNNAMDVITKEGFGDYFTHSLGHGLGIELHDKPNISLYSNEKLKEGMVITIEPGIYIPGKYGVRLEQAVLVTKTGHELLNKVEIRMFI